MASVDAPVLDDSILYAPPTDPVHVEVPALDFLMADGSGDPQTSVEFEFAVKALYGASIPIVIALEKSRGSEIHVRPLEALWWVPQLEYIGPPNGNENRESWHWILMIRQPDAVPTDIYEMAMLKLRKSLGREGADLVRFSRFCEGACVQLMHTGSFDDEAPDLRRLHEFMVERNDSPRGLFHEIYLADPRRCPASRMRTVLRQPIAGHLT